MKLTLEEIARHAGGRFDGHGNTKVRGYSIDSRSIRPGELFIAIQGPRFDGHTFLEEAARKGASGALVSTESVNGSPLPAIRVGSTLDAMQQLARVVRRKWGGTIVAVTGSAGKTTTKEMVAAVLGRAHNVLRSTGNLNNEYGLPLCLLRLEKYHDCAVLEMGMSASGEIRKLATIAEPNEGVITNVGPAHLEFFDSVDAIARAKAELLDELVGTRRAYLNNDDPRVRRMARRFDGEIVTYGLRVRASFHVRRVAHSGIDGTRFELHHGRRQVDFVLPLLGEHNVRNAAAAISVGITHGMDWSDVQAAIRQMTPGRLRGRVLRFREGFAVIDDCYNSNPGALTEMIRLLGSISGFQRRILVAGSMLELGADSARLHARCGEQAVRARIDLIVGVGQEARALVDGARQAGADPSHVRAMPDSSAAADFLVKTVREGDLVLLKGSRGIKLEQLMDALRQSFTSLEP